MIEKKKTMIFALVLVVIVLAFVVGPRPDGSFSPDFDARSLGENLDDYLKQKESTQSALIDGAQKEIRWFNESKTQTDIAIVYFHGYSATKHEIMPFCDDLANALEANLYYSRLKGHGSEGDTLAQATFGDWVNDYLESMAIAKRLGKRVVIVSTSTGSTLVTWALATLDGAQNDVAAHIMFSSNYGLAGISTTLMNIPHGKTLFPLLLGKTRSWTPKNREQARWWTTSYPTLAILPMAALLREAQKAKLEEIATSSLVFFSYDDEVVSIDALHKTLARFKTAPEVREVKESGDPSSHVNVGDIVSPQNNAWALNESHQWLQKELAK